MRCDATPPRSMKLMNWVLEKQEKGQTRDYSRFAPSIRETTTIMVGLVLHRHASLTLPAAKRRIVLDAPFMRIVQANAVEE